MGGPCTATIRDALKDNANKRKDVKDSELLALADKAEAEGMKHARNGECDLSLLHINLAGRALNGTKGSAPKSMQDILQHSRERLKALHSQPSDKKK